jgi:hypothetical protein
MISNMPSCTQNSRAPEGRTPKSLRSVRASQDLGFPGAKKNCTFDEEAHGATGVDIPAAVEQHVTDNHFAPDDFDAFIVQAATCNDTMRQVPAILREPPLPWFYYRGS